MNQENNPQREEEQIKQEAIKEELLRKERLRNSLSQVKDMIRRESRDLVTFAGDASISYQASADAEVFSFEPEENKVVVPALWFIEKGYSVEETKFAFYHELGHFIDMRKNPRAYLKHFEQLEQGAEGAGNHISEIMAEKNRDDQPLPDQDLVTDFAYQELYTLYTVFDDIYVNDLVRKRSPYYATAEGYHHVASLYQKLGYDQENLMTLPKHQQLIYYLFQNELKGGAAHITRVDPQVLALINKKILGRDLREIVDENLKPRVGKLTDPEKRYQIIRHIIQPMYLELLYDELRGLPFSDIIGAPDSSRTKKNFRGRSKRKEEDPGVSSEEETNHGEDFNPFKNSPQGDPKQEAISQEQIKKILEEFAKQDTYNNMSPEEREAHNREKAKAEFDQKHGIASLERTDYESIRASVTDYRNSMRMFWKELVERSIEYDDIVMDKKRRGRLNVDSFVGEYPNIIENQLKGIRYHPLIFDEVEVKPSAIEKPETIQVSFVIDCSRSMDQNKIIAAKQAACLTMLSIKDFNIYLDETRKEINNKLKVYSEVYLFGTGFQKVKEFERSKRFQKNEADIIKSITAIRAIKGCTNDALTLADILNTLSLKDKLMLKNQKLKKIIFEITDGEPDHPLETAARIQQLIQMGIYVFGFQIGEVNETESYLFNEVWNNNIPGLQLGIAIGQDLKSLPEKLTVTLKNALKDMGVRS